MIPAFRAKWLAAAVLAVATLFPSAHALAQSTRDAIGSIESEYARTHAGRAISDAQLEYYLDRLDNGWSMQRVIADIDATGTSPWRPAQGWVAREVICSSVDMRYVECPVPFRGTAVLLDQVSNSPCVEGSSWGQRPGTVWVKNGCRARFGLVRNRNPGPLPPARTLTCNSYRGRYHECPTGFRGQVYMARPSRDSGVCVEGRTWGQRPGVVWVRNNCRAQFSSVGRPGPRDDAGGGWTRRPNYAVTCVGTGSGRTMCSWDDRYGRPSLIQQISSAQCVEGRDWGYTVGGGIWVNSGCRATFGYAEGRYTDLGYRSMPGPATSFVRDPNYVVTCASANNGRTVCTWDWRYGNPYLRRQLSTAQCMEGRDWGYTVNGELWVNSGCRAEFGYH